MKPLVVHDAAAAAVYWVCIGTWLLAELAYMRRTAAGDPEGRDLSTLLLTLTTLAGLGLAVLAAYELDSLTLPGAGWWPLVAGLAVMAAALALRVWAIRSLGRYFKYVVEIQEGHEVIETGPYRLLRHPSYTGMIGAAFGGGLALGNWLSPLLFGGAALVGFTIRLLSEERQLSASLGEPYRDYMRRTWRLVPHVW